jgi:hypothetical protein
MTLLASEVTRRVAWARGEEYAFRKQFDEGGHDGRTGAFTSVWGRV